MSNAELRQLLVEYFNDSELQELCFDLGVSYEEVPGRGKREKAMELIAFMERRGRLPELLDLCRQRRANINWPAVAEKAPAGQRITSPAPAGQAANPFTYGNPISDPVRFFGRRREIEQVFSRLRNPEAESSSLVGGRRIGKTSLLKYLAHPGVRRGHGLDPERFIFVYVDLQMLDKSTTPPRLWQRLLGQIARYCQDSDVKYLVKELRESGEIDNFALADVFDIIDEKSQHIVLLLDEFENVTENPNFGTGFFYGLRSLAIQHNLSLVTSSHHELIELTHSEAIRSSPFFNIFANINLKLFTREEARELIASSLAQTGVQFTEAEIDSLLRLAGTYPYFLQAAAHFMFRAYDKGIEADQRLQYVQERFAPEAAPHMDHFWRVSNERERIVLLILALLAYSTQPARDTFSLNELTLLYPLSEQTVARLVKRALVTGDPAGYSLFSTTFGGWIVDAIEDSVGDGVSYEAWLHSRDSEIERLKPGIRSRILRVLPLIDEGNRDLVINWIANARKPDLVIDLLKKSMT